MVHGWTAVAGEMLTVKIFNRPGHLILGISTATIAAVNKFYIVTSPIPNPKPIASNFFQEIRC